MADGGSVAGFSGGGAPRPEAEHVAAARFAIVDDTDSCGAFGEPARLHLRALRDRVDAFRAGDRTISGLIADLKAHLARLEPASLVPASGVSGWFDSRSRRLKAFRVTYIEVASRAEGAVAAIAQEASSIFERHKAANALFEEIQEALSTLDAHLAAGRAWLDDHAAKDGARALIAGAPVDVADEGEAPPTAAEPPPVHPLERRLQDLAAERRSGLSALPTIRALHNAESRLPVVLKAALDAIEAWIADWRTALGLAGKRAKASRPDPSSLQETRDALIACLSDTEQALSTSAARRVEIQERPKN